MAAEFHVSHLVTVLAVSLFVAGFGVGPLLVGPLSEVYGRNIIYQVSFTSLFMFSWPIVFAPNIGTCPPHQAYFYSEY
jgi:MFS family permease